MHIASRLSGLVRTIPTSPLRSYRIPFPSPIAGITPVVQLGVRLLSAADQHAAHNFSVTQRAQRVDSRGGPAIEEGPLG